MSQTHYKKEPVILDFLFSSKISRSSLVLTLVIAFFLSSFSLSAQFVTTWQTTTANESITIPTFTGETYNYTVDWGDGTTATGETGDATHSYTTAGNHTVSITGVFPRIYFNNTGDKDKIISIDQWGDQEWTSMNSAFKGCSELIGQASDIPNLSIVKDLSSMFFKATIFNQNIDNWDVSAVENMRFMFYEASAYNNDNQPLNWGAKTSKVENMAGMFKLTPFNQDISDWDVSAVKIMNSMFHNAPAFNNNNQPLNWGNKTGQVIDMGLMFFNAAEFNQDISSWNVSEVTDMHHMFYSAVKFNQNIGGWVTDNVTKMHAMFEGASDFNQNIAAWNTEKVTNMYSMFNGATKFDQNLTNWNVEGLINTGVFSGAQYMFRNVKLSTTNYDALLISWSAQTLNTGVNFSGGLSQYCTAEAERAILDNKWATITDAGKDASCGTALTCPTISSSTTDLDLFPTLTWNKVTGATNYRVLVVKKSDGTQIVNETLGDVSTYTLTTNLEENTIYEVTLFASDGTTETTGCTAVEVETKISPATNGPAGVKNNAVFWVKASSGITLSGNELTNWQDQSGNDNHAEQPNVVNSPSLNTVERNYNPGVYFDGTDEYMNIKDLVAAGSTKINVFAVGSNESGGDSWHAMVFGQSDTSGWTNGGYGITALGSSSQEFEFWVNHWTKNQVEAPFIDQPTAILEGKFDGSSIEFFINAQSKGTDDYSGIIGDNGTTHLGGGQTTSWNHKGHINEVAIYNTDLSLLDRQKINSYFGIKYGITLDRDAMSGNYINSSGTSIYSDGGNSDYWNDIICIGRDDISGLIQKQSHQNDDITRLYLSSLTASNINNNGIFTSNNQFITLGHNSGLMEAINTEKPNGIEKRLAREWKLVNTNFTGTFTFDLQLTTPLASASNLRLLVDSDGDFSDATVYDNNNEIVFYVSGNRVTISGISTSQIPKNNSLYITIAKASSMATLTCPIISSSTTNLDLLPTITWNTITGASIYRILVVKKSDGTQIVNETLGDVTTYTLTTNLEENTIYEVTLFASDGTTETTGCTATEVQTKTTTAGLTCPTISSPTTNLDLLPTITWSRITGATNYRVLVIKKSDNTEIVNQTLGDVATYTLTTSLEENTVYEVTLFASDGTTETTGCTATEVQTKTTTVGLTCPTISSATTNLDLLPTITWNTITGASIYRILVVKKSDGTQIVNETLGDVSTYTLTTNLEENTVYEVTVFASDGTTETTGCTVTEVQTKNSITPNTNDIPNFFTPNNDGYNDTWQVTDTTNNIKHIQIFDRYGKLLKQFTTNSQGWDGNYMGNPMPNSDYWYVIIWNTGKPTKGHFSLIRR